VSYLVLWTVACGVELSQEAESDCYMEVTPGGWGPSWTSEGGVLVHPLRGADLQMEVRATLPSGRELQWTEDLPTREEPFSVLLDLPEPPERLRVRLTALHPQTGRVLGHQAIRQGARPWEISR
jgi:hypothetical protein